MIKKKNKKKSIKLILLLLLISLSIISYSKLFQKYSLYDDIIFFINLENSRKKQSNKSQVVEENNSKNIVQESYVFNVDYKGIDFKKINLFNSLNVNTLANGKIAPGIFGTFEIVIFSNINTEYKIEFQSLNTKPKNMRFWINEEENKYYELEKLSDKLKGNIKANENKKIKINWEWEYENNHEENIQDTNDAKNIQKYNFNIYVTGKVGE